MRFYRSILLQVSFFVTMTLVPVLVGRSAAHSALGQAQTALGSFHEAGGVLAVSVLVQFFSSSAVLCDLEPNIHALMHTLS